MTEQRDFFSPSHKQLLSIAVWAKYLAWVVLVVYILWGIGIYFQEQTMFLNYGGYSSGQTYRDFLNFLRNFPSYGFGIFVRILGVSLRGVMYYLILRGVSLGLNMIVETDINYREREEAAQ